MTYRSLAALVAIVLSNLTLFSTLAHADEGHTIDKTINAYVGAVTGPFVSFIFSPLPGTSFPWIVLWLVVAAVIFTVYFGFIQARAFSHAIDLVRGKYADPKDAGEVSHFQALATALSGTVGLGNIAGVAVAVSIGGPGATFWMILAGLLGMATKFHECTLGVKYRNEYPDGTVSGGPMYYLSKGLSERGMATLGQVMAVVFAVFCVMGALGAGNMFQANQVHSQLVNVTGGNESVLFERGWLTGAILAVLVFIVIIGGIKSIARFAAKAVPFMAAIYVATALAILIMNYHMIGWAFSQIFAGAFTGLGIAGGAVGALIQGFKRAAFSNEAGLGSASIAHSAVKTKEPITEGFVSLLEPFIDTVVICTMTALVIIITGVLQQDPASGNYVLYTIEDVKNAAATLQGISPEQLAAVTGVDTVDAMKKVIDSLPDDLKGSLSSHLALVGEIKSAGDVRGVALTSAAFATTISWFPYVLAVAVVLFAFSTMMAWSYYGLKAWTYLFGEGKTTELIFKVMFCIFIVFGAAMNLGAVINFADASVFAMALVNIAGLYILMPVVHAELKSYLARLKSGEIKPAVAPAE